MPEENQELIMQQFSAVPFPDTGRWGPSWRTQASRLVKSFVLSPEFHITGFNHKTDALGLPVPPLPPVIRPETTFKGSLIKRESLHSYCKLTVLHYLFFPDQQSCL